MKPDWNDSKSGSILKNQNTRTSLAYGSYSLPMSCRAANLDVACGRALNLSLLCGSRKSSGCIKIYLKLPSALFLC